MRNKLDISQLVKGARLITIAEVADRLSVSKVTVERLAANGKLRIVKVGRCTRFLPSDIDNYIQQNII